ncbi:unnamed protein product [Ranitomeya imitator]|uniref:C2H2-type domain-containing protein n=1 Tax=Ranitomeya imitator TaxID=111125 RepID=A0ABN9MN86_9NEOB|nr:unnamed protein product [Ranitomeya imitator]
MRMPRAALHVELTQRYWGPPSSPMSLRSQKSSVKADHPSRALSSPQSPTRLAFQNQETSHSQKAQQPMTPSSNTPANAENPLLFEISEIFEYHDPGSHWCEDCNEICLTLLEFLLHLHDEKHKQSLKEVRRPWMKKKPQEPSSTKKPRVNVPLKGAEFLVPVNGHYCELCEETFPDHTAADDHLRTYAHNDKYKKYIEVHIIMKWYVGRRRRRA